MKKTIVFTILFILVFSSFTFAQDDYPYKIKLFSSSVNNYVYFEFTNPVVKYGSILKGIPGTQYRSYNDNMILASSGSNPELNLSIITIQTSTHNIYDSNGDVFFSLPQATIPEIIQELPKNLSPTIQVLGGTGILMISLMIFSKPLSALLATWLNG